MPRKILHLDLDAFFCAVEEQRNPSLRGRPFAVGGQPEERGVVASCSYAARQFGIHSAMPMARAVRLCPHLIIVSSHYQAYQEASRKVMALLHDLTPRVEQLSIDEAFLDVTDLPESGELLARQLQARILNELGLPCSLGVATNKLIAKIANNVGKASAQGGAPPNAITVAPPGWEAAFLAPLPVKELWGVGPKTAAQLAGLGIDTIGEIARWSQVDLMRRFGKVGYDLSQRARGLDNRPVEPEQETKSISQEITFSKDISDETTLRQVLREQAEQVAARLREHNLSGATIKLKIRWADFTTLTRQLTLDRPTQLDNQIYGASLLLFEKVWPPGKPVRLIGVGVSNFEPPFYQLELWERQPEDEADLQLTLESLRKRFGSQTEHQGSDVTNRLDNS